MVRVRIARFRLQRALVFDDGGLEIAPEQDESMRAGEVRVQPQRLLGCCFRKAEGLGIRHAGIFAQQIVGDGHARIRLGIGRIDSHRRAEIIESRATEQRWRIAPARVRPARPG